jgi:hypothetical protein
VRANTRSNYHKCELSRTRGSACVNVTMIVRGTLNVIRDANVSASESGLLYSMSLLSILALNKQCIQRTEAPVPRWPCCSVVDAIAEVFQPPSTIYGYRIRQSATAQMVLSGEVRAMHCSASHRIRWPGTAPETRLVSARRGPSVVAIMQDVRDEESPLDNT